ncbi:MAG: PCRF domain-containing protein, partial [Muribaculaceae bacterium]|nr:PCRF domain-containing protein [Muribaculaceae bacterium]
YLELHAGAGGTEAQDWTQMLLRMYTRWAESILVMRTWLVDAVNTISAALPTQVPTLPLVS